MPLPLMAKQNFTIIIGGATFVMVNCVILHACRQPGFTAQGAMTAPKAYESIHRSRTTQMLQSRPRKKAALVFTVACSHRSKMIATTNFFDQGNDPTTPRDAKLLTLCCFTQLGLWTWLATNCQGWSQLGDAFVDVVLPWH